MFITRHNGARVASFDPFMELERMFQRAGKSAPASQPTTQAQAQPTFAPAVDVVELTDALVVSCDLPGFKEEQIDVRLEEGVLTLSAERAEVKTEGQQAGVYHVTERRYGKFERSFKLPASVNGEKVSARYENGVLEITLPKREDTKPRKITVGK